MQRASRFSGKGMKCWADLFSQFWNDLVEFFPILAQNHQREKEKISVWLRKCQGWKNSHLSEGPLMLSEDRHQYLRVPGNMN